MADPASILGLIAASLTITIRAATIGKDLHTLISKFQTTNSKVRQLSVHVAAVRVAARSLSSWLEDDAVGSEEVEDVKSELLEVLSACGSLLSDLQDHVAKALVGAENVSFKGTVYYIWDEDIIRESTETLHHQETVLILMLQALERLTSREQRARLQEDVVIQTLTKAKRPSSSIFGLQGDNRSSTRFSYASENSEKIDAVFTFDMEVLSSTSYRNAFTSLFRRNLLRQNEQPLKTVANRDSTSTITATERLQEETSRSSFMDGMASLQDEVGTSRHIEVLTPGTSRPGTPPPWATRTSPPTYQGENSGPERNSPKIMSKVQPWKQKRDPFLLPGVQQLSAGVFCRVLYDFEESDSSSLSMRRGETVQVISKLGSGWWDGTLNGRRGFFPSNYCEITPDPLRSKFDDSDGSDDVDEILPFNAIDKVTQRFASALPIEFKGDHEQKNVMLGREEDLDTEPSHKGTAMQNEPFRLAKPHVCAKGERCSKWRKQQRQLARMQAGNHAVGSESTETILMAELEGVQEGPVDVRTWMASIV